MFCFTPLPGFFSPFPRGTVALSVTQEYLALRGGPRRFTRNFTCSVLLGIQLGLFSFRLRGFHPLWRAFQTLLLTSQVHVAVPQPHSRNCRFRLFPVRSPLLRESFLLSFPPATKMFQFAGLARASLWIQLAVLGVAPFGNSRIKACFQLPETYRR